MNDQWFEALTRRLAGEQPRRRVTGGLISILVAAAALPRQVEAGCKKVGKKCDKNKDCCDGAKCEKDKCKCKNRFAKCDKKCYDLDKDENHCGACDTACASGEICRDGMCQPCVPNTPAFESPQETCDQDADCCGDGLCCTLDDGPSGFVTGCYDLRTNVTACGLSCEAIVNCLNTGQICVNGECVDNPDK